MSADSGPASPSGRSDASSTRKPVLPQRTTKETHPHLPPGLILGPDGKPCKVCNSWQDWAKLKVKKKQDATDGDEGSSSGSSSSARPNGMGAFAAMMSGAGGSGAGARKTQTGKPSAAPEGAEAAGLASTVEEPVAWRSTSGGAAAAAAGAAASTASPEDRSDCPPDTAALGRSTWTFLHTAAAYYPPSAPLSTQIHMGNMISSLSLLYPCVPCATDFQEDVRENPPDLTGREAFSRWLCERHNAVNDKLGKPRFSCDWSSLNKRWKDGPEDGRCD